MGRRERRRGNEGGEEGKGGWGRGEEGEEHAHRYVTFNIYTPSVTYDTCRIISIECMNSFKGSIFSPFIDNVDYIPLQNYYFNFSQGMIENDTLCVNITIIDDNIVEEDEELYAVLSSDSTSVRLKEPFRATIVIINNDCMSKFILIECLHLCTGMIILKQFSTSSDCRVSLMDTTYYTTMATGYAQICAQLVEGLLGKTVHINLTINDTGNGKNVCFFNCTYFA